MNTIVDASIRELHKLRAASGDGRLKIIASALNFEHCRQIVEAYRSRGQRADYVHSKEDGNANELVMKRLKAHELDVIIQVRKLGEGFDHPYLAVAAVFSVFSNLSPFVQFVGRIMRVIKHNAIGHPLNNGVVVFHAGANIAQRWEDFQSYSEADREFFDQLLPLEGLYFEDAGELEIVPGPRIYEPGDQVDVRSQTDVRLQEIPLLQDDPAAMAALKLLQSRGYTAEQVTEALESLQPVPVTKARVRQAKRAGLDMRIKTAAARVLAEYSINPEGQTLDKKRLGRSNLIVMKSAIDRIVNETIDRGAGERSEFTKPQLDKIDGQFTEIVTRAVAEVIDGN